MSDVWVKLDVDFPTHPKVLAAGPTAAWAFLAALCYSRRYLTDGHISYEALHAAYSLIEHQCGQELASPEALGSLLEDVGLLEANGDGWLIHDYAVHQQTKQMVQERKAELSSIRSQAGRKGGKASAEARRSKSKLEVEKEKELNPPTPLEANARASSGVGKAREAPAMIDAVEACHLFIIGQGWDESFTEPMVIEEFGRIERARRTTGSVGSRDLADLLEQWRNERQTRYPAKAET